MKAKKFKQHVTLKYTFVSGLLKTIWRAKAKDTTERIAILDAKDKLLRMCKRLS